jgi:hypothetical protein
MPQSRPHHAPLRLRIAAQAGAGLLLAAGAAGVSADEIHVDGKTLQRVQVVGYAGGQVEINTAAGERDRIPLRDIEFIVLDSVTGVADFNQAEELLVKREPAEAVERYERAVRAARGFWASMARVRLLMAADAAGDLEKAVRAWLEVAAEDPATAADLMPQSTPSPREQANDRTRKRLEKAITEQTGDPQAVTTLLYYDVARRTGDPLAAVAAEQVARTKLPAALITARTLAIKLEALRAEIAGKRFAAAGSALDALIADAPQEYLPAVLILKSQALLAGAQDEREFLQAALPAMRVVVHFPQDALAAEGLVLAAEAHERAGRTADAERLLRECLRRGDGSERVLEQARSGLSRLLQEKG